MTTRALQELDGGLGSCQGEDLSMLADPCPEQPQEGRARGTPGARAGRSPAPVHLLSRVAKWSAGS